MQLRKGYSFLGEGASPLVSAEDGRIRIEQEQREKGAEFVEQVRH